MSGGRAVFVGCGPGAPDLLTLRAVRALERADIVIWNRSLLDRRTLAGHTRAAVQIVEWPPATQQDIEAAYDRALAEGLVVVRLKGGDPSLMGVLEPELSYVRELGLGCELVPGVSSASAAGAALTRELATRSAPLLVLDAEAVEHVPAEGCTIFVLNAGRDPAALQRGLLQRGLAPATPCTVAIELSRRDETLVRCALEELAETVGDVGRGVLTTVLVAAARD